MWEILAALVGGLIAGLVGWGIARYQHSLDIQDAKDREHEYLFQQATQLTAIIAPKSSMVSRQLQELPLTKMGDLNNRWRMWQLVRDDITQLTVDLFRLADLYQHFPDPETDISEYGTPPADLQEFWMGLRVLGDMICIAGMRTITPDNVTKFEAAVSSSGERNAAFVKNNAALLAAVNPRPSSDQEVEAKAKKAEAEAEKEGEGTRGGETGT